MIGRPRHRACRVGDPPGCSHNGRDPLPVEIRVTDSPADAPPPPKKNAWLGPVLKYGLAAGLRNTG